MRKTQTQTCRNGCRAPARISFYHALFMLSKAQCLEKGKDRRRGGTVKDASSALSPIFTLFPLESRCLHQSLTFLPLIYKHIPFYLMNLWHWTHTYVLTHSLSSLQPNLTNLCPLSPSVSLNPQAMSLDCDTHTLRKCAHAYTLSIVMNDPLRAELTSWDHFLLLFFFLWPFTLIH